MTPRPDWVDQIEGFVLWLDEAGNGYAQYGESAFVIPKGEALMFDGVNVIMEGVQVNG